MLDDLVQLNLSLVGLAPDAAEKYPSQLSGGMVKRAALARALSMEPKLLFLDEPTSGLDPISAADFDALLLYLHGELKLTVVMITHDLDSLFRTCDRVSVIVDGRMVTDTLPGILENTNPWIREYFHGPRARAAERAAAGRARPEGAAWIETPTTSWSGAFVLLVIGMALSFVYWYTDQKDKRTYQRYEIYYDGTVSGLTAGSPVRYLGVDVGKVARIMLDPRNRKRVEVIADIEESAPIDTRTLALLSLQGVTGLLFIDLEEDPKATSNGPAADGRALSGDPLRAVRPRRASAQPAGAREPRHRSGGPHGPGVQRRERRELQGGARQRACGERPRAGACCAQIEELVANLRHTSDEVDAAAADFDNVTNDSAPTSRRASPTSTASATASRAPPTV